MIPAPLSDSIRSRVFTALAGVTDPEIRKPITDLDMVSDVTVSETGQVTVGIRLTIAGCPAAQRIESDVLAAKIEADKAEAQARAAYALKR